MGRVAVIVLAAGAGTRLALGPKAHVMLGGMTLLARISLACRTADVGPLHVVGSVHDQRIASAALALGARLTSNDHPERGMASSVYLGLEAARRGGSVSSVLVWPVDVPRVRAETLARLEDALEGLPEAWAGPVYGGESGHPVGLGAALVSRLAPFGELADPPPLRDALRRLSAPRVDVAGDDPGVVMGINDAEDLERARRMLAEESGG